MNDNKYAEVWWTIEDIKERRPNWSDEEAQQFLDHVEGALTDIMIERGWNVIDDRLLSWEEENG